jgi:hypothetical protein
MRDCASLSVYSSTRLLVYSLICLPVHLSARQGLDLLFSVARPDSAFCILHSAFCILYGCITFFT